MVLQSLRQHVRADANRNDTDWREWSCTIHVPVAGRLFDGRGATPALAIMHARMLSAAHAAGRDVHRD